MLASFLQYVEKREGIILTDPVLKLFHPVNVTWVTFILIYGGIIIALIYFMMKPDILLVAFQSYSLMVVIRLVFMYVVPLNPPEDMIPLNDPFVTYFGTGVNMNKDLFFSGHTSTMFLLALTTMDRKIKFMFFILTVLIAFCVLIQHVHYTIDVLIAPFISYSSYKIILNIKETKNFLIG